MRLRFANLVPGAPRDLCQEARDQDRGEVKT
jgi:hypothetical protein